MKMYLGNMPIKKANISHFEMDTNDCTMVASDLQAGVTAVARGQKITGTGKCFEFAHYGGMYSNDFIIIPTDSINVVHISSLSYPVHSTIQLSDMKNLDFNTSQVIGNLIVDNVQYPISVCVQTNESFVEVWVVCDIDVRFQIFLGKDNYV